MKRQTLRRLVVVFLMLWLPVNQVLAFNASVCPLEMGSLDHPVLWDGLGQAVADTALAPSAADREAIGCMMFMDCHSCHGWAFPSFIDLQRAVPILFVATFKPPYAAQFDPEGLERPPRTLLS
jgi:hypothetical protein